MCEIDGKACGDFTNFEFQLVEQKYDVLEKKEFQFFFRKWGMIDRLQILCFNFNREFKDEMKDKFFEDFFKSGEVVEELIRCGQIDKRSTADSITSVAAERVPCSVFSLDFFDRMKNGSLVRDNGVIVECPQEYQDEIVIGDELRKLLLLEDESDHNHLFGESDRRQFIFRLFRHLVIGGVLCQYEGNVFPYYTVTKQLYKDLLCVTKSSSGVMTISSEVYSIKCYDGVTPVYPSKTLHIQDFAYFAINALSNSVNVLFHRFQ